MYETFKIAGAIIASLGGGALLIAIFSSWLGSIWAKRMLQNERAKHAEKLENYTKELELLKDKSLTRHHDKLSAYRESINLVSEILSELEAVAISKKDEISPCIENSFSVNRNKIYGCIALVSNQEVMDSYNALIDFLIPIIYKQNQPTQGSWEEMRSKADTMLNAMRKDLGINDGEIYYRGER